MKMIYSNAEFAKECPKAWEALPETYRNIEALNFKVDKAYPACIICFPKPEHEAALGKWIGGYSIHSKSWIF